MSKRSACAVRSSTSPEGVAPCALRTENTFWGRISMPKLHRTLPAGRPNSGGARHPAVACEADGFSIIASTEHTLVSGSSPEHSSTPDTWVGNQGSEPWVSELGSALQAPDIVPSSFRGQDVGLTVSEPKLQSLTHTRRQLRLQPGLPKP
jgi:hypothetical protein